MAFGILETALLLTIVVTLCYWYCTSNLDHWKVRGVKGPKPVPFFGNTWCVMMRKISIGDYQKLLYDEYKDEKMIGIFVKTQPTLILKDLDLIKKVLVKDFSNFPNRHHLPNEKADPLSSHLISIEAVRWRPLRTKLSSVFTSGKLKEMFPLVLECADHLENYLTEQVAHGEPIECRELMARYTIDVIGSCGFGIEMNAMSQSESEFRRISKRLFRSDLTTNLKILLRETTPWLFTYVGHFLVDWQVVDFFTRVTMDTIDFRKENNIRRHDFMDALLEFRNHPEKLGLKEMPDTYLAAQAFAFFVASFETSSATLSNVMYELALNSSTQQKLREELKNMVERNGGAITYDTIKELKYMEKVVQETLRKHAALTFIGRTAEEAYTFEGTNVTIPKGQKVYIPTYAIHLDPELHPHPEVFDPERFDDEAVKSRHSMSYLPFGVGPRNCIGGRFSMIQVKLGLVKIFLNHTVEVCERTQIPYVNKPTASMVLQPNHGIFLRVKKIG